MNFHQFSELQQFLLTLANDYTGQLTQFRQDITADCQRCATRKQHDLEHRLRDLKRRPTNSGRTLLLKELEKDFSVA